MDKNSQSTLVTKAVDATTFTELQEFMKDLEGRPLDRILHDLAELVNTSDSKAQIVGYVLTTKYRHGTPADRYTILDRLDALAVQLPPGEQRDRILEIGERVRAR